MQALTAQSWNYSGWIYNVNRDRWESLDNVFPGEEHRIQNMAHHANAVAAAEREQCLFRSIDFTTVPEPTNA